MSGPAMGGFGGVEHTREIDRGWKDIAFELLHGPKTKDALLVQYEVWATISTALLIFMDFAHCVGHATLGHIFLLMCSLAMMACAMIVADVEVVKRCNPAPGSPRVAFALFWLVVARMCYLFPTSIIHAFEEDAVAWLDFLNVLFSAASSVALFRAYQRLQVLEDEEAMRSSPAANENVTVTRASNEYANAAPKRPVYGAITFSTPARF